MKPIDEWLYFGCYKDKGHYLWRRGMHRATFEAQDLCRFDGMLAPRDSAEGYIATVSRIGGWNLSALSFWDYTIDKRPGCNSIFFAPAFTVSAESLMEGAAKFFPEVWTRLPEVKLHPSVILRSPVALTLPL